MASVEEEKRAREWEQLSEGERQKLIAQRDAAALHYGWCQKCKERLEGIGGVPPTCPHCGHGLSKELAQQMWEIYMERRRDSNKR